MTNAQRKQIRDSVMNGLNTTGETSFRELLKAMPPVADKVRGSEILSVIYPMVNAGTLELTQDLKLRKLNQE